MNAKIRHPWAIWAMMVSLLLAPAAWGQDDDLFGDSSTSDDSELGFDSEGFDESATADAEAQQQKIQAAADEIRQLQEAGDWAGALEKINAIVEELGGFPIELYYEAGRCHAALGNDSLAMNFFSQVITAIDSMQNPQLLSMALVRRGELFLKSGSYLEATDDFTEAVSSAPQNPEAHFFLGRATLLQVLTSPGQGRDQAGMAGLQSALKSLTKAIELKPDYGEAYLDRGRTLLRLRQTKYAIEDHKKAVELLGEDSIAVGDLALTFRASAQAEGARKDADVNKIISDLRSALDAMDKFLKSHSIHESSKPWETSDPLDIKAHQILITRAETLISLGDELNDAGQYEAAIKDCNTYLGLEHLGSAEKARGYFTRGLAERMLERFDAAIADFGLAIEYSKMSPLRGYPEANLRRGIIYFHQGEYALAIQDFETASSANPFQPDPRIMLWLGLAHARQGEFHEAASYYTKAITVSSDFLPAYMNRGLSHMKTGRYGKAFEDFNTVLRLDPTNERAKQYRDAARQYQEETLRLTSY